MPAAATGAVKWNPRKGIYEARIAIGGGSRKLFPLKGFAESEIEGARALAKDMSEKIRAGVWISPNATETVSEWFARYFDWRKTQPNAETIQDRRSKVEKWVIPVVGKIEMLALTSDDLRGVVLSLEKAVSAEKIVAKTACNIWGVVTKAFADACEVNESAIRVRKDNPAERVRGPWREESRAKPFLRPDELLALLSLEEVPAYRRTLYAVAAYTGARIGEIRGMTVADIDFDSRQIFVTKQATRTGKLKGRTKTGRARAFPIEPAVEPLLRAIVGGRMTGPLLAVRNEDHSDRLREDLVAAGCLRPALFADDEMRAPMRFHNLRDTCCTHMAVRRDPPQDIQWRAGHTTAAMTEKYIAQARFAAGANFGQPFPPIPESLLRALAASGSASGSGSRSTHVLPGKAVRRTGVEEVRTRSGSASESDDSADDPAIFEYVHDALSRPVGPDPLRVDPEGAFDESEFVLALRDLAAAIVRVADAAAMRTKVARWRAS